MTTTFLHPLIPEGQNPFGLTDLKALLLEPLFMIGACLFWLAVLPLTGAFCAGVAIYDKIMSLKSRAIHLPDLRHNPAHNPLVLRKKSTREQQTASHTRSASQAFQS
jgi:hypothetical protein